jgi:amidophosphoribosyltransferase
VFPGLQDIRPQELDDRPREECGVVGITGWRTRPKRRFSPSTRSSIAGRKPRASWRIDAEGRPVAQGAGLVSDVFDAATLGKLPGSTAVGHVRYSTAGGNELANVAADHGALCARRPRARAQRQPDQPARPQGAARGRGGHLPVVVGLGDARPSHREVAPRHHRRARRRRALPARGRVLGRHLTDGRFVYAARDPRGFRPLVLGKLGDGHIATSETCALDILGADVRARHPSPARSSDDRGKVEKLRSLPPADGPSPASSSSSTSRAPTPGSGA